MTWVLRRALTILVVGAIGFTFWLVATSRTRSCRAESSAANGSSSFTASRVVAEPWFGKHHVYATFLIPLQYHGDESSASLHVEDFHQVLSEMAYADDGAGTPGYFQMRVYFQTRLALRQLIAGRFGELSAACNWTLRFPTSTAGVLAVSNSLEKK